LLFTGITNVTPNLVDFLQLSVDYERAIAGKQEQDAELRELRQNKELLTQWERQIADIIQWVTEEKDARAYLKSVAKKLADDVDNLKTTAGSMGLGRVSGCDSRGCGGISGCGSQGTTPYMDTFVGVAHVRCNMYEWVWLVRCNTYEWVGSWDTCMWMHEWVWLM